MLNEIEEFKGYTEPPTYAATGKTTTYSYNANTNVLEWVKYPEDTDATKTAYTYDSMYRMATAAATTDTGLALSAKYTYADDMLTAIQTGSTTYSFGYGNFALRSSVKIGSRTLASYTYTSQNNYLDTLAYGNSDSVKYTYDDLGRVTKQTYEDGATVTYRYDNDGALATVTDSATGRTTTYYYDFIDRMMKYVETGSDYSHSVGYEYDTINNLTKLVETINGTEYSTSYSYDDDNRVTAVSTDNSAKNYTYDGFGRVSQQVTKHGTTTVKTDSFSFKAPSGTTTSSQVTGHTIDTAGYDRTFAYTYDDNGNILSISGNGKTVSYVYDSANQLVRENNEISGKTKVWTYDNAGNILTRKEYAYTTGTLGTVQDTVNYTYGDSSWGDLLTAYDGVAISHDTIGNPLNDGTWTYTWRHGRQLASMSNGTTTWNFTYNADGLRTKRTNGSTTYSYVYNGDKLSQMTVGSNLLYFSYDASGTPMTVLYNGTTYYYATNIQGDVIAILNASGTAVVEYAYDAWGNIISTSGTMAETLGATNPLRYRSYIYDQETQYYYLQSRYHDPEVGRFLNADAFASTGQGILGTNTFIYCNNNPITFVDSLGERPIAFSEDGKESDVTREWSYAYMNKKHRVDLTDILTEFMEKNAAEMMQYWMEHSYLDSAVYFLRNITDGGTLDIKLQDAWKFEEGKAYYFNGIHLRYDDPGNINFGYVGAVLFPKVILCAGAGANQISKWGFQYGDITTFFDDPRDNQMIKYGYQLYMGVD